MIRILLVDDRKTSREFLKASLESAPDLKVVGIANDGHTAIEQVEILQPDIVLMDAEMPDMDGISATQIICKRFPTVKIVIFSMHESDDYVIRALQAGAMGYLSKSSSAKELEDAIKLVYRGSTQIGAGLLGRELKFSELEQNLIPIDAADFKKEELSEVNGGLSTTTKADLNKGFSFGRFYRGKK
jgi:hemolysin D